MKKSKYSIIQFTSEYNLLYTFLRSTALTALSSETGTWYFFPVRSSTMVKFPLRDLWGVALVWADVHYGLIAGNTCSNPARSDTAKCAERMANRDFTLSEISIFISTKVKFRSQRKLQHIVEGENRWRKRRNQEAVDCGKFRLFKVRK